MQVIASAFPYAPAQGIRYLKSLQASDSAYPSSPSEAEQRSLGALRHFWPTFKAPMALRTTAGQGFYLVEGFNWSVRWATDAWWETTQAFYDGKRELATSLTTTWRTDMGLDMYAYTLRKAAADAQNTDVDVNVYRVAAMSVGFAVKSDHEFEALSAEEKDAYSDAYNAAIAKAKEDGHLDTDFAYWRKFNALHGWMQDLYERKGGADTFNCATVRLTEADLDELEAAAIDKKLAPVQGFFFGGQEEFSDDDRDEVVAFCAKAREAIRTGSAVFYDSWW